MKITFSLVLAALLATACQYDHTPLRQRAAHWQAQIDASVPTGTSIEAAKAWGAKHGLAFSHIEQKAQLYAIAERVPETGFNRIVCSDWSIVLKVQFSAAGTSEKNEVSTIGTCL